MKSRSTELLVIGGGILGLGIAWDACLRGIKVLVVEQGDLGQGTSGRYHGLLHSGARYAISDPVSAQECAQENRILRRIATDTIEDTGGLFLSTPADPADYPGQWLSACRRLGIPAEEIAPSQALAREPRLNDHILRAFVVQDASLDSFQLLRTLAKRIRQRGGQIWLRHRATSLIRQRDTVLGAEILAAGSNTPTKILANLTVNASGAWGSRLTATVGIPIQISLSKGTLVAFASRPLQTVISRCRPPADGDILVPVGTVMVAGTTDLPVETPETLAILPSEIDLLLANTAILLKDIHLSRPLRAWSGIRSLPMHRAPNPADTRSASRSHTIVDHALDSNLQGLITVFGGKLTTFRLIAQQVADIAAIRLGNRNQCQTDQVPISDPTGRYHTLPQQAVKALRLRSSLRPSAILCECELVSSAEVTTTLGKTQSNDLDDLRRALRLGMGPCQSSFCLYRATSILSDTVEDANPTSAMADFAQKRWRGMRPLAWGQTLAQVELMRRIHIDLLSLHRQQEGRL